MPKIPIAGQEYSPLKGQPGYSAVENPKFDPRILNIPFKQVSQGYGGTRDSTLYRGALVAKDLMDGVRYKVNFLYNPSTISEARSLDINNPTLPPDKRNVGDTGDYQTGLATTISFSLLFDRTYELWDKAYQGTDVGTYGVQVDTNAFYNITGINRAQVVPGVRGGREQNLIVQGPMFANPLNLYFGYGSPGSLSYFGYISGLSITYTHFSQQMVPSRCAIGVNFILLTETYGAATTTDTSTTTTPTPSPSPGPSPSPS